MFKEANPKINAQIAFVRPVCKSRLNFSTAAEYGYFVSEIMVPVT